MTCSSFCGEAAVDQYVAAAPSRGSEDRSLWSRPDLADSRPCGERHRRDRLKVGATFVAVTATFFGWLAVRVCAEGSDRVRAHVSR